MNGLTSEALDTLATEGWVVLEGFLPTEALAALRSEADALFAADALKQAGVGQGGDAAVIREIRGDHIGWFEPTALTPAQRIYWDTMEDLRLTLNRELYLGLADLEAHYACFPPGAFYKKHLDRFAKDDARQISAVLYLNPDWTDDLGGHLRLYLADGERDLAPTAGTLVLFRSDTLYHEVRPATAPRYSVTGWFRRRTLF